MIPKQVVLLIVALTFTSTNKLNKKFQGWMPWNFFAYFVLFTK